MRFWIDGYEANVPQRLGSSQVAFELLTQFERIDKKNEYTIFLPDPPLSDLPKERKGWKYRVLKPKRLWTRIALPFALYTARQKPDLFFSPSHYLPRFLPSKIKKVVVIFDLSFLHFPEMFNRDDLWKLKNWTKFSVNNADCIVTISKFSKEDIYKEYSTPKKKITIAYPGYDKEKFRVQSLEFRVGEVKKKYNVGDNYLIYIGTIQPRKNIIRLMEAFGNAIHLEGVKTHLRGVRERSKNELELVIVGKHKGEGKQGWKYEDILKSPQKLGIESRVKFLGFVPTDELAFLISGATAFIQPSLYEGFGIPVAEAMACGVPVIVSDVSSLPEVVGQAGLLVNPYSVDQMEQAIRTIVADKKLRKKYSKAGLERVKMFSCGKMAKEVLKVFDRVEKKG